MIPKNALELLFEYDFGKGPLFKNQIDLVNELVNNRHSVFYLDRGDTDYARGVSRTKAYISQLFSDSARRMVTPELQESLKSVLKSKLTGTSFDPADITNEIVSDLRNRNKRFVRSYSSSITTHKGNLTSDLLKEITAAKYISIFAAREINFEYEMFQRKLSFIDLLMENLILTIKNSQPLKFYRFNFPLEQTCKLFWRGLRKEIAKYLKTENKNFDTFITSLKSIGTVKFSEDNRNDNDYFEDFEDRVASELLNYLSKKQIINVFHLKAPIYIAPSVALNPHDTNIANTYLFLQTPQGLEQLHRLTKEEWRLWKLFVWDNLKINKSGTAVGYSSSF